ncbi:DNA cytosine methyltransferase [Streptomyces cacaoi]|uniref:DNA cytosine methyltransferase n=1 Tax=Streptomyces cacaoi TaxID=1898 RepID=UPI00260C4F06|nr:DNA (cytosine-5-)-methyltransferase [Streptomyces cacaoi]
MGPSRHDKSKPLTSIEVCAGAGGQAIGLHEAGFKHLALLEIDKYAAQTLGHNRNKQKWQECAVLDEDLREFKDGRVRSVLGKNEPSGEGDAREPELDLLAGGVPCPPFSVAGHQLGGEDERDLFPDMARLVKEIRPRALMIENVRGIMDPKFDDYCADFVEGLQQEGYWFCGWHLLEAKNFGVPQLRPRAILVAIREEERQRAGLGQDDFPWPVGVDAKTVGVFETLKVSMRRRRDVLKKRFPEMADAIKAAYAQWEKKAKHNPGVAPTLVGGSKKHGGADLGPSRAKRAWKAYGVDANGVAEEPEQTRDVVRDFLRPDGPMLTVSQAALIQGFPVGWEFVGGKTAKYRQVGNAFPPPVAMAVGRAIASVLVPECKQEHLDGLVTRPLGARRGTREFTQTEIGGLLAGPRSAGSTSAADLDEDLVGAGV